ncbi:MAG: sugar phosphate isomerase/epimerase [Planctomycetaceae bacterium]|nr:sugar phosphate isomerase/epimerase [Planctomycetaceae bacterium]MCB9951344.1 sugar phosphate isomerase/epimerase [Planctomycetaceae bacterium]
MISRRHFLAAVASAAAVSALPVSGAETKWKPKYILGSCMFGETDVHEIMPEVHKIGATAIDIWPRVHGNQREQLDEMGEDVFRALLEKHDVSLGCITQYKLGPFGLKDEMQLARRFGCPVIVTGAKGPKGLSGSELKAAVGVFAEQMKPHLEIAEETGVTIAIENHGGNLMDSADALRYLMDLRSSDNLGVALAPYHLDQDPEMLAKLIRDLGDKIAMFYAWQHGMGCMTKLPKEQELLQMPGRGDLDFGPLMTALSEINYQGWFEIFMHPVPRGVPILEPTSAATEEINRARAYLEGLKT